MISVGIPTLDAAELEDAAGEDWNAADAASLRVEVGGCAGTLELMFPRAAAQRSADASGGGRRARGQMGPRNFGLE